MSGQSLLIIGGLLLFSFLALTFQNSANETLTTNFENEALVTGEAIGQSILETVQLKAFDEKTVSVSVDKASDLSTNLGKESGESAETSFDDIDDYDGYKNTISLTRLGNFEVAVDIYYINQAKPDTSVTSPTFSKRIDITITNSYLTNPLKLSSIASY